MEQELTENLVRYDIFHELLGKIDFCLQNELVVRAPRSNHFNKFDQKV